MSEFPTRLWDDDDAPDALRADLRAALPSTGEYDVAAGLARFEALLADGAGDLDEGPDGNGDSAGGGERAGGDSAGGGEVPKAASDLGMDPASVASAGTGGATAGGATAGGATAGGATAGGATAGGATAGGATAGGATAGGATAGGGALAGGAEVAGLAGSAAIPGLATSGSLFGAKLIVGLAVIGALGTGIALRVSSPGGSLTGQVSASQHLEAASERVAHLPPSLAEPEGPTTPGAPSPEVRPSSSSQREGAAKNALQPPSSPTPDPARRPVEASSPVSAHGAPTDPARIPTGSAGADSADGTRPADAAASAPAETEASRLREEMEHLASTRKLSGSDPARAAAMALEGHGRFRKGVFWQEREVVLIQALAASGQRAEAKTRGDAFLARHPESPFTETLRRTLGLSP
ncbi:hypothetical protein [Chondromyces crocatus]|uniref:Uncharacterized protein n=1 Tax=Chondromyces crocatus TaxID=52 RepID=A0A0K1EAK0_CHOCO|nr:hypothetical protein [Chondromyces crocatus]AKT37911.1 uncharacterized protein CMC5_020540 [Chondromyces crocatus]